jgi:cytochrome c oxidase subunit 2
MVVPDLPPAAPLLQSALAPASAAAEAIDQLGLVLFAGGAAILALVLALAAIGALGPPRRTKAGPWLIGGGLVFPVVVLGALLGYALHMGSALSVVASRPTEIEVTGRMWWWEVRYVDAATRANITLANELYVPIGRPIEIALRSDNVIHSFWVPALAGKVDMVPGRTNRLVVRAREAGVFRGQCAEYCGTQHAWMAFYVVAVPEEAYRQWLARQAAPAAEPADAFHAQGRRAFLREGCGACHTVRGTPAAGTLGPDLTHVGSRLSLGAGRLDNHVGTLAGWIADSQTLKPGNLMPAMNVFSGEDLRAVAAYLESLK